MINKNLLFFQPEVFTNISNKPIRQEILVAWITNAKYTRKENWQREQDIQKKRGGSFLNSLCVCHNNGIRTKEHSMYLSPILYKKI